MSASPIYKVIKAVEGAQYVECLDGKKRKIREDGVLPCLPKKYLADRKGSEVLAESEVIYDWDGRTVEVALPTGEHIVTRIRLCQNQKCACIRDPISWREIKVRCPKLEKAEITDKGIVVIADPYPFKKLLLNIRACTGYPRLYSEKKWIEGIEVIPGEFGWAKIFLETPSGLIVEEKELWGPLKMSAVRGPFGVTITVCGDTSKSSYVNFDPNVYDSGIIIASFSQMISPQVLTSWPPKGMIYLGGNDKVLTKTVVHYKDPAVFKYNKVLRVYEPIGTIFVE